MPSLVGYRRAEAEEKARAAGWNPVGQETAPPWPGQGAGAQRVVGQRLVSEGNLLLVYCYEDYIWDKKNHQR